MSAEHPSSPAPATSGPVLRAFAHLDDIDLYYEAHGHGQPLLLLHGGLSSGIEQWHEHIPALGRSYQVIVPDARGHGRSTDTDQPFSYARMAEDYVRLLDILGIDQANVVGWSDGAIVGLSMVTRYPTRVRALVATEPNFTLEGFTPGMSQYAATLSPETLDSAWAHRYYLDIAPDPNRFPQFLAKTTAMWLSQPSFTGEEFARNRVPILLISGAKSVTVPPAHLSEWATAIPQASIRSVPEATHSYPLDEPALFLADVLGFLDPYQP